MIEGFQANPDADPHALHEKMRQKRLTAERSLSERLKARHQGAAIAEIAQLCDEVRRYLPYRETAKHYLLLGHELLRLALLEIDRRKGLASGVFYLHYQELPGLMSGKNFAREIAERRERRRAEQRVNVPEVVLSTDLEAIGRPDSAVEAAAGSNGHLHGTPVAPGSGSGPAAIVFDPTEAKGLTSGYVLVCPSTDPGWTPLFIRAAGLVMERGGVLSHGAVVARDLGIPAVVIKGATRSIAPGETIRVDGNAGTAVRVRKG
jgi:pyruvate,water dikinase